MTTIELRDLETRLAVWRAERHLTTAGQKEGLLANILEELTEFVRAQDDNERVDACCDILIFLLNSKNEPISLVDGEKINLLNKYEFCNMIFTNMFNNRAIHITIYQLEQLGYDSYKCMLETIKEISSRTGHFDETIGKFVKDKSPEAQAKWYKADYSICKKEQ